MLKTRSSSGYIVAVLVISAFLMGCGYRVMREAPAGPPSSMDRLLLILPALQPAAQPTEQPPWYPIVHPIIQPNVRPTRQPAEQSLELLAEQALGAPTVQPTGQPYRGLTAQPTPTLSVLGAMLDSGYNLRTKPIDVPLELQIPALKIKAPVLGVGLTWGDVMDTPKGLIDDPIWQTAFWYRGSSVPGEPGTTTFAGHVNDTRGRRALFGRLDDLRPGDLIIVHVKGTAIDIHYTVNQVKVYSIEESSAPDILRLIYGIGPVAGTGPQIALDGLSHLTLITCAGNSDTGRLDHHTVVFATLVICENNCDVSFSPAFP